MADQQQEDAEVCEVRGQQPRAGGVAVTEAATSEFRQNGIRSAPCLLRGRWQGEDQPSLQKQSDCPSSYAVCENQIGVSREGELIGGARESNRGQEHCSDHFVAHLRCD